MDRGEYDVCTYCGKSIFPDAAECPYCHQYTDGKGAYGLEQSKRLPRIYVIAGWLVIICFVLPILWLVVQWLWTRVFQFSLFAPFIGAAMLATS